MVNILSIQDKTVEVETLNGDVLVVPKGVLRGVQYSAIFPGITNLFKLFRFSGERGLLLINILLEILFFFLVKDPDSSVPRDKSFYLKKFFRF